MKQKHTPNVVATHIPTRDGVLCGQHKGTSNRMGSTHLKLVTEEEPMPTCGRCIRFANSPNFDLRSVV